jgi:predicted peptidase
MQVGWNRVTSYFAANAMRYQRTISALAAISVLAFAVPATAASINDVSNHSLVDSNNTPLLRGLLHVPAGYAADPRKPRPLILFLHGAGESGTDNRRQINGNIDNLLAAAKARDAFLYAPQTNSGWNSPTLLAHAMTMIDRTIDQHSVDPNRIYVTGLSMGGGGAWNFLNQFSHRVAATVPICAVNPTGSFTPADLLDEAIWAFHGRSDQLVPVTVTRNVINRFLSAAGQPIPNYPPVSNTFGPNTLFEFPPLDLRYTDMRGDHGIWGQVYNMPGMYDWLFAHGAVPEPSSLILAVAILLLGGTERVGRFRSA